MTLATHAVVGSFIGAAAAASLPLAAVAGFASHFIMDSIPHWDYPLASSQKDEANELNSDMRTSGKGFILDLFKISCDLLLGLIIVYIAFHSAPTFILIGAFTGALFAVAPDALQFVYWKLRRQPIVGSILTALQKFHLYIHAKTRLNNRPFLGITSQLAIILIVFLAIQHFFV